MREYKSDSQKGEVEINWILDQVGLNRSHLKDEVANQKDDEDVLQGTTLFGTWTSVGDSFALDDGVDVVEQKVEEPEGCDPEVDLIDENATS